MQEESILIIQLFSNGDCLYATTVAKQIKYDNPNCNVSWLVYKNIAPILFNNPYVDEVIMFDKIENENSHETFKRATAFANNLISKKRISKYYFTQILSNNYVNYDGCIRNSIYRNFGKPITVDKVSIVINDEKEKDAALNFYLNNGLKRYKNIVLFETSPLSGQVVLTENDLIAIANNLGKLENTCVVISSFKAFENLGANVFNGCTLSIRETVAFTHYCSHLLGCSSGITWASLSNGAKKMQFVQFLNPKAMYFNPPSIDFKYSNSEIENVIELYKYNIQLISELFLEIFKSGFSVARLKYNQKVENRFLIYRGIVFDFLKRGEFKLIIKFLSVNFKEHGLNFYMIKSIILGFVLFPFQLGLNFFRKLN